MPPVKKEIPKMRFAEFYQMSTGYVKGTIPPIYREPVPIPACGDRSVILIDQRIKLEAADKIARYECEKRGYVGYAIYEGPRFSGATCVQQYKQLKSAT